MAVQRHVGVGVVGVLSRWDVLKLLPGTPDRWEWSLLLLQLGHECHLVNPLSSYPGLGFRPQI